MNYKLKETAGKVKYLNRYHGNVVGTDTSANNAMWILNQYKPEKSDEFPGYPIAIKAQNSEYFFAGEWLMGGSENVLTDETQKPQKRRERKGQQ